MKSSLTPIVLYIHFILAVSLSCGPSRPEFIQVDPAFRKYISGYTSGMVYRDQSIRVELSDSVQGLEKMAQKELNSLMLVEPEIKGKVIAISNRILEFVPEEQLPMNQLFTVDFAIDELMEIDSDLGAFQFQFSTFDQKINVDLQGLRNYSYYEIEYQQLRGTISTTDYEDSTKLRKTLSVELDGKKLPVKFKSEGSSKDFSFVVDSIRRIQKEQELIVKWDGGIINSFSTGMEKITVASLNDFSVNEVNVTETEDQIVRLSFSEPLSPGQDLNGIVRIEGVEDLTFKVYRNELSVFLPHRVVGQKRLRVNSGIKNVAGFKMKNSYSESISFHEPYPRLRIKGKGSILPNSQGLIFPFEAIALTAVDVRIVRIYEKNVHNFLQTNNLDGDDELTRFGDIIYEKKLNISGDKSKDLKQWNTHVIDLQKCITPERGAIYQVSLKFDKAYSICDCPVNDEIEIVKQEEDLWNERNWHTYGFGGYSTWSYYDDERGPCDESYYYGKAVKRNILASDIGMIFKLDEDKTGHAFLSDMLTTAPVSGASISFYDYTNNLIATVRSDNQGMAKIPFRKKPFLMIAKKGEQRGYLKLTDGHVNSLSKFNVEGEVTQKGVKGYIYAERGVWRPGDSIFVSFILQDKLDVLPDNHPVTFEFHDPNGNVIYKKSTTKNINGVYDLRTATSDGAVTGNYRAKVEIGNNVYTKSLKVETIKPNRLKINLEVDKSAASDSCRLNAKWLHGASAKNLDAQVQVHFSPMKTMFKGYEKFVFDSPVGNGRVVKRTIFNGQLDESGSANFSGADINIEGAPGMLQANYITKVFEKSGEFSIDRTVSRFSPYETYVGLEIPQTSKYDNTLETDKLHLLNVVALNKGGGLRSRVSLNVQIYKLDWNWWFDGEENLTEFTARTSALKVMDSTFTTKAGKAKVRFRLRYPDYGKFLIVVKDKDGGHMSGKVVHVDWPYWSRANRSENEFAKMLSFSTDKEQYVKGETIKVTFPSPSNGRALVSIETGSKVIRKIWVNTQKGETSCEITATADMAPNAYVHVTLLQPHHSTKNDLPIRMYGVLPVFVDDPNTHLEPIISMNDKIRPESTVPITVTEKSGRKMTYTLAIVDDGLLDLSHFKTPQPWNSFYAKEALGVKTWDMYDDVIGAYGGSLSNLLSVGGDGTEMVGDGPKANRFEPMVRFLGPFELKAGASQKHMVAIPNYVGSVRVMVVARDEEAYGNVQKTVVVKKPLMVLATLPRVIGCGEEFSLPVDVFAMEKHIRNVQVSIEANGLFESLQIKEKAIQFNAEGDEIIDFRLKTKEMTGVGKITVVARCGNETARQEIEIDVRPSNPRTYEVKDYVLHPGESIDQQISFNGIRGTNRAVVELSTVPSINLGKRLDYLIDYPHGCVEQTTSAVFPQLYLSALVNVTPVHKKLLEQNIRAGVKRLQSFQTSTGGFSYWPGGRSDDEWGTNYAGNFLLEAEKLGYHLPSGLKNKWITFQRERARNWSVSSSPIKQNRQASQLTQAYRLYLLAVANTPELGAMNRLREERDLSNAARWRLAGAYRLLGQKEVADELILDAGIQIESYAELSNTFGSDLRDKAMILETLAAMNDEKRAVDLMKSIARELSSDRWMSTQETAYCLLALAKYCKANNEDIGTDVLISSNGANGKSIKVGKKIEQVRYNDGKGTEKQSVLLKNRGKTNVFVTVIQEKVPKKDQIKTEYSGLEMEVKYLSMEGKMLDVANLKQGTEFMAEVRLTNPTADKWYREMALNQIFPAGWEIFNTRFYGEHDSDKVDYKDFRDDRVYSYFSLAPKKSITIQIQLTATYKGRFYLPALYAEAMYDHSIRAQLPGKWVLVSE